MSLSMQAASDEIMSEINMTPMVDVMLVLLVIFMITIPTIQHSVKMDLPQTRSHHTHDPRPPHIRLAIRADGRIFWDGVAVPFSGLSQRVADASARRPQPELHLYAERQTPYEHVAQVMTVAQSGGLNRIGFVTDSAEGSAPLPALPEK